MLRRWVYQLLMIGLIFTIDACGVGIGEIMAADEEKVLIVGPEFVDCEGEERQKCLLIKRMAEEEWELFYDPIEGFEYEEGYIYELVVRTEQVENPPADGSSLRWILVEVINKTQVEEFDGTKSIEDVLWIVDAYRDQEGELVSNDDKIPATAEFHAGVVTGYSGCNTFKGSYTAKDHQITFSPFGTTRMACEAPLMDFEMGYLAALGGSSKFQPSGEDLLFLDTNGETQVRYRMASPISITGAPWEMSTFRNGDGQVQSILEGTKVTAIFTEESSLSGSAGCNHYSGTYEIGESSIRFGPMTVTEMFCAQPDGIMEQENSYLEALVQVNSYQIDLDNLELFDEAGAKQVDYRNTDEEAVVTPGMFQNMTYESSFTESGVASLQEGVYREQVAEGNASETVVSLSDRIAIRTLEDGSRVAAVILINSTGGSGTFYELALVRMTHDGPVHIASTLLGDRVRVISLSIEDGQIFVEMIQQGPEDPMCCPSQWVMKSYELDDDELVEISSETLGAVSAPELLGEVWKWVRFSDPADSFDVENPEYYTIEFLPDETLLVQADCNRGSGVYTASQGEIDIEILLTTLAMCRSMSRGDQFIESLNRTGFYFFEGSELYFDLPYDSGTMVFMR